MKKGCFRERVAAHAEPELNTGCLLWPSFQDANGYCRVRVNGKLTTAHRAAWAAFRGPIPAGAHVLHRCDTPSCVNPDHLFLGTHLENMRDKAAKGRCWSNPRFGPAHHASKFSVADVLTIRTMLADGIRQIDIARKFAVTAQVINDLAKGRTYAAT